MLFKLPWDPLATGEWRTSFAHECGNPIAVEVLPFNGPKIPEGDGTDHGNTPLCQ